MLARAAGLRERADELEAKLSTPDPLAEHFTHGTGGAHGGRAGATNAQLARYVKARQTIDQIRSSASSLEASAERCVFADDPDGLVEAIAKEDRHIAKCDQWLADGDPRFSPADVRAVRSSAVARRARLRKRLEGAAS